jgi:hypothetical protein
MILLPNDIAKKITGAAGGGVTSPDLPERKE